MTDQNQLKKFDIDVLLATFNGANFLEDQLESILCQVGVRIRLIVSDDGSTDETINIIAKYSKSFKDLILLKGPGKGPKENFFHLLKYVESPYAAFSDQDDLWLETHLIDSIKVLEEFKDTPALVFSNVKIFGNVHAETVWPREFPSNHSLIFENLSRGCTQVFTKELAKLSCYIPPAEVVMHDWALAFVAKYFGSLHFLKETSVFYRLHEHNFTSVSTNTLERVSKLCSKRQRGSYTPLNQAITLFQSVDTTLTGQGLKVSKLLHELKEEKRILYRIRLIKATGLLRQNIVENFALLLWLSVRIL